jgi:hypothetical protein
MSFVQRQTEFSETPSLAAMRFIGMPSSLRRRLASSRSSHFGRMLYSKRMFVWSQACRT